MGKKRNNMNVNEAQLGKGNRGNSSSHNTEEEEEEEFLDRQNNDNQNSKKRGRGVTKFKTSQRGEQPKVLQHNERGQRIGVVSKALSTHLGTVAREFVPYTLDEWTDVDEDTKQKMWFCVQEKFVVEEWERKSIFQHLNKLWRDQRSKLQVQIRKSSKGNRNRNNLSSLKPNFMNQKQWDLFVRRTLSPAFQEKAAHFIEMKAKQTHSHTTGREGYARLEDRMNREKTDGTKVTRVQVWLEGNKKKKKELSATATKKMNEVLDCPIESRLTTNLKEDALSIVFGKEARGSVRGMGFGVTPSKVGAQLESSGIVNELQGEVRSLKQDLGDMKATLDLILRQQNQNQAGSDGAGNSVGNDVNGNVNSAISQLKKNNVPNRDVRPNTECKLFHTTIDGVVAEGRIASTNPNDKVHHMPLGKSYWKVWVDKVIVEDVELFRPNEEMKILAHAIGSTVAWLPNYIVLEE